MANGASFQRKTRTVTRREIRKVTSVIDSKMVTIQSQKVIHPFHILNHMDEQFAGTVMTVVITLPGRSVRRYHLNVKVSGFIYMLLVILFLFLRYLLKQDIKDSFNMYLRFKEYPLVSVLEVLFCIQLKKYSSPVFSIFQERTRNY